MRKVWFFGDSFTAHYEHHSNKEWAGHFIYFKGYTPKHWTEILGERLGLPIENRGYGGSCNYTIFDSIIQEIDVIQPDDYIVIGWTDHTRYRIADEREHRHGNFASINVAERGNFGNLDNETLMKIIINRDSNLFINEIVGWMNLLRHTFKTNHIIHWSMFQSYDYVNILNKSYLYAYEREGGTIRMETENRIDDGHPGEKGSQIIAATIYQYMKTGIYKDLIIEQRIPFNLNPNII